MISPLWLDRSILAARRRDCGRISKRVIVLIFRVVLRLFLLFLCLRYSSVAGHLRTRHLRDTDVTFPSRPTGV